MRFTLTGRNIEITESIKNHLNNKMDKTIQSVGENTNVHVALHVEKYRHVAEVTVKAKGFTVHANEETNDLYLTMDSVLEKIKKQLKKHKERSQDLKIKKETKEKNYLST